MSYCCYLLVSKNRNRTYIGMTNNLKQRIRRHNGEISGGARATAREDCRPWQFAATVHNFNDKIHALKFEWRWKHEKPMHTRGVEARIAKLHTLMERFQVQFPSVVPLEIKIHALD